MQTELKRSLRRWAVAAACAFIAALAAVIFAFASGSLDFEPLPTPAEEINETED